MLSQNGKAMSGKAKRDRKAFNRCRRDLLTRHGFHACSGCGHFRADVVFLLNDFWMLKNYRNTLTECQSAGGKVLAYSPLDGPIVDESILWQIDFVDWLVLNHQPARKQVENAVSRLRRKNAAFKIPELAFAHHGVDHQTFFPTRNVDCLDPFNIDRVELKARFFSELASPEDAFVVLNANRLQPRKRLDLTISGFGRFARRNDNVWLCLHHPFASSQQSAESDSWLRRPVSWTELFLIQTRVNKRPAFR